jgi:hypothetical protein
MQTIKTELIVNGRNVLVGHQFLEDIVRNIPDVKENKSIFARLAQSDTPEVRESISRKDNLNSKTIHLLLKDDNQEIVDNVLSNSDLAKHIKEDILFDIIETGTIKYLKTIASNIDSYVLCDTCKVATILSKHQNTSVRYALVHWGSANAVTSKILKALSKDKDFDIANEAKKALEWR